jgi:maltose/moltooligosaccharide transporter
MSRKPKLTFWQIWNLSFGFLGVQIGYSLQNSNTSGMLKSFGADLSSLSYFWLLAPIAGLIVQPIIGMFSDQTWTKLGRRKPYILAGAIISTVALCMMPNCPRLLAFAPLLMGAIVFLFMDLSFNITMQPFRALVTDMLDDSQKTEGFVVQTFLINLGSIIGALLPLLMTKVFGVSDAEIPGHAMQHVAYSYYAGAAILFLSVLVTIFTVKEYPPKEFNEYNASTEAEAEPKEKPSFWYLVKHAPKSYWQLGVTQFFSWAALFLMWNYLQPLVTKAFVADGVVNTGQAQTWTGVLNAIYPVSACVISLVLTSLANKFGNKPMYAICLFCGAIGYTMLALTGSKVLMAIAMLFIGVAWAGILAMPYSIFSRTIDARSAGAYMGIFNFTVTIPQICMGLCGGLFVSLIKKLVFDAGYFQSIAGDAAANALAESKIAGGIFLIAGLFMLLASISVHFVSDKKYND